MATRCFEFPRCDWSSHDHISIKNHYVFSIDIYVIKPMNDCSWFINCWIPIMKQKNRQFLEIFKKKINYFMFVYHNENIYFLKFSIEHDFLKEAT
jgi:hypothetical protein